MKKGPLNRRKVKIEELLLILIFALVSAGSAYFGDYTARRLEYENASRGYYSENALAFVAHIGQGTEDISARLCQTVLSYRGVSMFSMVSMKTMSYVCAAGAYKLPMTSGDGMTSQQSAGSEPVAIMGKNEYELAQSGTALGRLVTRGGTDYFVSQALSTSGYPGEYKVLGIMGNNEMIGKANSTILLNLGALKTDVSRVRMYILDGPSKSAVNDAFAGLEEVFGSQGSKLAPTDVPKVGFSVSEFFAMDRLNVIMRVFAIFCVVFATVPLTLFWSEKRRKAVAVRRLLGSSTVAQALRMLGRMLVLFHTGFAIGTAAYFVITQGKVTLESLFSVRLAVSYAAALTVNLLICAVPFYRTMRIEPGDALRKE